MTKILSKFGEQQLVMVNYACGFNQSEMGKYFDCIINIFLLYENSSLEVYTSVLSDFSLIGILPYGLILFLRHSSLTLPKCIEKDSKHEFKRNHLKPYMLDLRFLLILDPWTIMFSTRRKVTLATLLPKFISRRDRLSD